MSGFHIDSGPLAAAFDQACARLETLGFAEALWARRLDVWTNASEVQAKIANRLGWLDVVEFVTPQVPRLQALAASIRTEGITDIVLLGMGGSSLAPEVLRQVLGVAHGFPRFQMLDSVDPEAVRTAMAQADTSLFVLASKSGSTIEPNVMAAEAQRRVQAAGRSDWGRRFIAITDEGTALHRRATAEQFRDIFVNPTDIGGRYSALSFFGMVPAALMGADVDALLASARAMATACRASSVRDNPGLALGALMAAGAQSGRDKLTLLLPERLQSLGLWVEQLVAESTGKQGKGVVPIAGEPVTARFGPDRLVVALTVGDERPEPARLDHARQSGAAIVALETRDITDIGGEFFRWEVATATAGVLLQINPFDEPNVQQAKDATRKLLESYEQHKRLPIPEPHAALDGVRVTLSAAAQDVMGGAPPQTFFRVVQPADYVGLLAYLPPGDAALSGALEDLRGKIAASVGCATMFGYGPRYLHSTGQLHKGGANNGVFVVITAEAEEDLKIPGEPFSFAILEMAQAVGDFQSLDHAGRRAVHLRFPRRDADLLRRIGTILLEPSA